MRKALLIAVLAVVPAGPAAAAEVQEVRGDRLVTVDDPYLPAGVPDPALPPEDCAPRRATGGDPAPARTAAGPSVRKVLRDAMLEQAITPEQHNAWRAVYDEARRLRGRLKGGRRNELNAVIVNADRMAGGGLLTVSRMPAVFLTLQRNTEYWRSKPFPGGGGGGGGGPCAVPGAAKSQSRLSFPGSLLIWQWYSGQGLQIQPLANFGKANALYNACKATERKQPCRPEQLRQLLDELMSVSSRRGDSTAWEYYFRFGGGNPPWVSGLAQGTAIQALARGAELLGNPAYLEAARSGLGIFERAAPTGVRVSADGGNHYLIYSFNRRLRVLNGFLQAVIGLHDFAKISGDPRAQVLFEKGERAARAAVPRFDTGAWSLYAQAGRESDLGYHRLVRDFLKGLCERLGSDVYCGTATRFTNYLSENPKLEYVGPGATTRAKRAVGVRFRLSKVSCVAIAIKRGSRTVYRARLAFGHGLRSFQWTPPRAGRYSVRLEASDLRNHHAVASGSITVRSR